MIYIPLVSIYIMFISFSLGGAYNQPIVFDSTEMNGKMVVYPSNDERCFDECLPCVINPLVKVSFLGPSVEYGIASQEHPAGESIIAKNK